MSTRVGPLAGGIELHKSVPFIELDVGGLDIDALAPFDVKTSLPLLDDAAHYYARTRRIQADVFMGSANRGIQPEKIAAVILMSYKNDFYHGLSISTDNKLSWWARSRLNWNNWRPDELLTEALYGSSVASLLQAAAIAETYGMNVQRHDTSFTGTDYWKEPQGDSTQQWHCDRKDDSGKFIPNDNMRVVNVQTVSPNSEARYGNGTQCIDGEFLLDNCSPVTTRKEYDAALEGGQVAVSAYNGTLFKVPLGYDLANLNPNLQIRTATESIPHLMTEAATVHRTNFTDRPPEIIGRFLSSTTLTPRE